tara:strand:- start:6885 stop:7634 length:750 start_codon:yes stop_codon:yes gene_type:complete
MGFFPPDHKFATDTANTFTQEETDRFYSPGKQLKDGDSHEIIVCGGFDTGHVISGYKYFKNDGQPHTTPFSEGYPKDYKEDIGLNYEAKFKRKVEYGSHTEDDLDKPKQILSFIGYIKEKKDFAIIEFNTRGLRTALEEILSMDSYEANDDGVYNFMMKLARKGSGTDTVYTLTPAPLKAPVRNAVAKKWAEIKDKWYLPALYDNADPFAGKPAEATTRGLPPTHRDELGADHEIGKKTTEESIGSDWV